jgi:hypothetical protein
LSIRWLFIARATERLDGRALVALVIGGVAVLVCASPPAFRGTIASAAGLVLEAAPFVAGAALLQAVVKGAAGRAGAASSWTSAVAALGGCGCGGLPAGLSLPAAGLAWLAFGPLVAASRLVLGAALLAARRTRFEPAPQPLDQLAGIVPFALAGSVGAELLRHWVAGLDRPTGAPAVLSLAAGALAGLAFPCGPGAVALAGSLVPVAPWAAAGFAVFAGAVAAPTRGSPTVLVGDARAAAALLVAAALGVAASHGAGLIHPRIVGPLAAASLVVAVLAWRHPGRSSLLAPALVCVALVLGSPPPRVAVARTALDGAFAGQLVHFTGVLERRRGVASLVRFAITCCRADASPVALRLDHAPPLRDGTWATVDGTLAGGPQGLIVRTARVVAVAPPRDPFIYR